MISCGRTSDKQKSEIFSLSDSVNVLKVLDISRYLNLDSKLNFPRNLEGIIQWLCPWE